MSYLTYRCSSMEADCSIIMIIGELPAFGTSGYFRKSCLHRVIPAISHDADTCYITTTINIPSFNKSHASKIFLSSCSLLHRFDDCQFQFLMPITSNLFISFTLSVLFYHIYCKPCKHNKTILSFLMGLVYFRHT